MQIAQTDKRASFRDAMGEVSKCELPALELKLFRTEELYSFGKCWMQLRGASFTCVVGFEPRF